MITCMLRTVTVFRHINDNSNHSRRSNVFGDAQILPNFTQISSILPNIFLLGDAAASPALTALAVMDQFPEKR